MDLLWTSDKSNATSLNRANRFLSHLHWTNLEGSNLYMKILVATTCLLMAAYHVNRWLLCLHILLSSSMWRWSGVHNSIWQWLSNMIALPKQYQQNRFGHRKSQIHIHSRCLLTNWRVSFPRLEEGNLRQWWLLRECKWARVSCV